MQLQSSPLPLLLSLLLALQLPCQSAEALVLGLDARQPGHSSLLLHEASRPHLVVPPPQSASLANGTLGLSDASSNTNTNNTSTTNNKNNSTTTAGSNSSSSSSSNIIKKMSSPRAILGARQSLLQTKAHEKKEEDREDDKEENEEEEREEDREENEEEHEEENEEDERLGRPIITGCLEECGTLDQACVTDCQVCVEQTVCTSLHDDDCSSCLSEAHKARALALKKSKQLLVDSGGISLVHEGLRQKFVKSKMRVLEGHRALRRARSKVLDVQRLSEWAAAELRAELKTLNKSRTELDGFDAKSARWLNASKVEIQALQEEVDKTRRVLRGQKKARQRVEERLAEIRSKGWMAAGDAQEVVTATRTYRQLRFTMRTTRRELKVQKAQLRKLREDRVMLRRSLRHDGRSLIKAVKENTEIVRHMREQEHLYDEELRKAKRGYRHAAAVSQAQERVQSMLAKELAANPLPDFRPKAANRTEQPEQPEQSEQSVAEDSTTI